MAKHITPERLDSPAQIKLPKEELVYQVNFAFAGANGPFESSNSRPAKMHTADYNTADILLKSLTVKIQSTVNQNPTRTSVAFAGILTDCQYREYPRFVLPSE